MSSPFPGMNPYLEHPNGWAGFHLGMAVALSDELTPQIAPLWYAELVPTEYPFPAGSGERLQRQLERIGERVRIPARVEALRLPSVQIKSVDADETMTTIELRNPWNKSIPTHRDACQRKWQRFMEARVHFVEIDLLRGGQRTPWGHAPQCEYAVTVSRWEARPTADYWPIRLRERLPIIPVPLREGEPEPTLDLQSLLHRVYDAAGY